MKIKALLPFTIRDSSTGDLTSIACGQVANVTDTLGNQLISDGLAEAYTLVEPTGTIEITENGVVDVSSFALADINVTSASQLSVNP